MSEAWKMQITAAEFVTSAVRPDQYPPADLPEIAFAGRSNVGKSSLINTLVNRKRLVKTSATPGRTQLINFFRINQALIFVDLPGFGYARAPEAVRRKWGAMVEQYVSTRRSLSAVVVLLDIRREPGGREHDLLRWLAHHRVVSIPVITKCDKLSRSQQLQRRARIARNLGIPPERFVLFSAKTRQGVPELWEAILALAGSGTYF